MREFYSYVWRSTARRQILLIALAISGALLAMAPLELQRHIINSLAGREAADGLIVLCAAYLAVALGINGLKFVLNIKSAGLGEAAILALRQRISTSCSRALSAGKPRIATKDIAGTMVTMISSEAEAVGKFAGECISTPIVQAGTLLSVLGYMLWTEPTLGLVVLVVALPQAVIAPVVQRRINVRVKQRVRALREAGDLIVGSLGDGTADDMDERDADVRFDTIYRVRLKVFALKFEMKFAVSALQTVGIFILLLVGGIMVLKGRTEIGIVVAFIAGMDRVIDPWRELIAFVRAASVARIQFDMIETTLDR